MNIAKFLRTAFLYNISDGCFCVSKVCVTKTYHLTVKEFSVTLDFILPVGNRTNEREIIVLLSLKSEIFRHFNDFISVKYLVFMYLILNINLVSRLKTSHFVLHICSIQNFKVASAREGGCETLEIT